MRYICNHAIHDYYSRLYMNLSYLRRSRQGREKGASLAEKACLAGGVLNPARGAEMRAGLRVAGTGDRFGRGVINRRGIPARGLGGLNALGTGHFSELRLGGPVTGRVVAGHPATLAHAAPNRGLHIVPRQKRVHFLRPGGLLGLQFMGGSSRRRRRVHGCPGARPLGVGEAVVPGGVGAARAGLLVRGNSATREVAPLGRFPDRFRVKGDGADLEAATKNRKVSAPVHVARCRSIEAGAVTAVPGGVPRLVGAVVVHSKPVAARLSGKERRCQLDGPRPLEVAVLMVIVRS